MKIADLTAKRMEAIWFNRVEYIFMVNWQRDIITSISGNDRLAYLICFSLLFQMLLVLSGILAIS